MLLSVREHRGGRIGRQHAIQVDHDDNQSALDLAHEEARIWCAPVGWMIESNNGSTNHFLSYADYSHGIRLVRNMVRIGGELRPIMEILTDPIRHKFLSDRPFASDWPPSVSDSWK